MADLKRPAAAIPQPGDPTPEEALMRFVIRLGAERQGLHAIQFHLARLTRAHRNRKHLSIAANLLSELLEPLLHDPFILRNGDVVVLCRGSEAARLEDALEMLRYLLKAEPPLTVSGVSPYTVFDLEAEYLPLLAALLRCSDAEDRRRAPRRQAPSSPPRTAPPPAELTGIMQRLERLELAPYLRRQTVWELVPGEPLRPLFDELSVADAELGEALALRPEAARDSQVAGLLTRAIDKYVLAALLCDRAGAARPVSISVHLQSLLSAEFLKFESQRHVRWHGRSILEMQFTDLWADLPAFLDIVRTARQDGFSWCVAGVPHTALPLVNLNRLEADFLKLVWDDAMLQLDEAGLRELCRALRDCGMERIVLTRCGRVEALRFGQAANIRLFQGAFIDELARELVPRAPVAAA